MKSLSILLPAICLSLASCESKKSEQPGNSSEGKNPSSADTYVIYNENFIPEAGRVVIETNEMRLKDGEVTVTAQGQEMVGSAEFSQNEVVMIENIAADKKRYVTTKDEGSEVMTIDGQPMPDSFEPSTLLNIPVTLAKKDGTWIGEFEDGQSASTEQQEEIDSIVDWLNNNLDKQMYGTEARKIGETWTTDAKDLQFFGDLGDAEGQVTLTLNKVAMHEGQQCAFMTGTLNMTGTPEDLEPGMEGEMTLAVNVSVIRSLQQQLDLKATFDGKMEMSMRWPMGGMQMSGQMSGTHTNEVK